MNISILRESGYLEALFAIGLSYGLTSGIDSIDCMPEDLFARLEKVAGKLSSQSGGHNKFLESIVLWLDITAMRGWWQQFDTYRCGVTKNSESTMHTILKSELTQDNFEKPIHNDTLDRLNELIRTKDFEQLKIELPEGFLQRRFVCLNYKSLRNIINQRKSHRLIGWSQFCDYMIANVEHPEFLRQ